MGWKELLQKDDEQITVPWLGGRTIRIGTRTWSVDGKLPREFGWYTFKVRGRKAMLGDTLDALQAQEPCTTPPCPFDYFEIIKGYLIGDRIAADGTRVDPDPKQIVDQTETVHLIEAGLGRFTRIQAGRVYEGGPLVFDGVEMGLGPEDEVTNAYEDRLESVNQIQGVTPALDAAFRMECFQRSEAERRRAELERLRREEQERLEKEARRKELIEKLGDGAGRRQMALQDFAEAARAALAVSGAEYLDHRQAARRHEMVVRFRFGPRRYECTCDQVTLRIIDSGICLTDHVSGQKGDTWLTLESLPTVIREAINLGKLVVYRHVDAPHQYEDMDEDVDDL